MRSRLAARRRGLQRPTLSSWTCFRAPPKSLRWIGPMSPASLELRSSTIASSSACTPSLKGGSCHFSVICIVRSPVPGSSHFPPALLTRQPLTSPTLWVLWSRVTPPCRWLRILWPHIFHLLWLLLGSPAPWIYGVWIFPSTKGSSRCWRWGLSCLRSRRETGLSPSTWRMRIFTSRSFKDTGDSFGSPLEGRLTNTRSCPSAWLWPRGHLPNAWMLHWPLWGSRASVYWTIWTTGSFWLTPGS